MQLRSLSIHGYRAVRDLAFEPGRVCALVGEASSGKSTVLTAIWTLLEAAAPPPTIDDVSRGMSGRIHLEAELDRGQVIFLDARPPDTLNLNRAGAPPVLFFPANLRPRTLVAAQRKSQSCSCRRSPTTTGRSSTAGCSSYSGWNGSWRRTCAASCC
jgi:energy-coupling factor transporter ATP-binding protein EcfA2